MMKGFLVKYCSRKQFGTKLNEFELIQEQLGKVGCDVTGLLWN